MPYLLGISSGFITNSSSVVHNLPMKLLEHPKVKAFMEAYDIHGGFIGNDLWSRDTCVTIAITEEQKRACADQLTNNTYGCRAPTISEDSDTFMIIRGDEYESIASVLVDLLRDLFGDAIGYGQQYN